MLQLIEVEKDEDHIGKKRKLKSVKVNGINVDKGLREDQKGEQTIKTQLNTSRRTK